MRHGAAMAQFLENMCGHANPVYNDGFFMQGNEARA
jgi:hypothetical protein